MGQSLIYFLRWNKKAPVGAFYKIREAFNLFPIFICC